MAFVYLRTESNNKNRDGYIINTKNIESFVKLIDTDILKFRVYLMNGENYDFNQLYYEGNFINIYDMYQLYGLLSKLDSGVIQDGGETWVY